MDDNSSCLPKGVQRRKGVDWRHIEIQADRSESVSTVDEHINQTHSLWVSGQMESPLCRPPESSSKLGNRKVTQALGCLAHGSVRPEPSSKKVQRQRPICPLSVLHEMSEHVAYRPPLTPRCRAPRRLVERFDPVGELATKTSYLLPFVKCLHDLESCKKPGQTFTSTLRRLPTTLHGGLDRRPNFHDDRNHA